MGVIGDSVRDVARTEQQCGLLSGPIMAVSVSTARPAPLTACAFTERPPVIGQEAGQSPIRGSKPVRQHASKH